MEYWVIAISLLSFALLFVTLIAVFRMVHAYDAVPWYLRIATLYGFFCLVFWGLAYSLNVWGEFPETYLTGAVFSCAIYGVMAILFLFGVFGVFEASITLHILTKIALAGSDGIHPNALLGTYNRSTIVKRRVDRFLWSGEFIIVGGRYRLSRRFSYFMVRERFLNFLRFLFPRSA